MGKYKRLYLGKGFYDYGVKGMEERGVAIESITYASLPKKTTLEGYCTYCAIEQNGKLLGRKEKVPVKVWVDPIEKIAPNIKGSFFGFGPYKNVTITGVNSNGFNTYASTSAKSANGVTCNFYEKVSVYLSTIDLKKFKPWMREWGVKFGLKKKGNVWISKSEWQTFIVKMLIPFTFDSVVKNMNINASGTSCTISKSNYSVICDKMKQMMQTYLAENLGLTVGVYFA